MDLVKDFRFGLRIFARNSGFTCVVVVVLALGIGANTTVFTLANAVLFKGLPFEDSDRIMHLNSNDLPKGRENIGSSYPDYLDWRAQSRTLKGLAAYSGQTVNFADKTATPERYSGTRVTANAFSLLGQRPLLGRDFTAEDAKPGAADVTIIGYSIWKNRYGADGGVLGRVVRLNNTPAVIIGVMPEGFKFPSNADLWMPLVPGSAHEKRENRNVQVFGRLADRATLAEARAEMDLVARRLEKEYPKPNKGIGIVVKPYNDEYNGGEIRTVFLVLLGAVGFVLLIACANVANLLLARASSRSREMSIRAALGAGRWRVVRQLLVESLMLGALGGAAGLFIGYWGVRAFDLAVVNTGKPYWIDFSMNFTVFAYLAGVCLITSTLFGVVPALQAARTDINETLKEGSRGSGAGARSRRLSAVLVIVELTLAVVLLAGAGLMIRSFLKFYTVNLGIDPHNLLTMRLNLADAKYPNADSRTAVYDRLRQRMAAIPGVESAAIASALPGPGAFGWTIVIEGQPTVDKDKLPSVSGLVISPEYFRTAGATVLRGRPFSEADGRPGQLAAIVNQRFAAKYWPKEDPLGKRLRIVREGEQPWLTVVGVCSDIRQNNPSRPEIDPVMYVPFPQDPLRGFAIMARTRTAPETLVSAFRKEVQTVDEDLPVWATMSFQEYFSRMRWPFRVFGTLFAVFALIALVLSSVGIYAVIAYSVSQRTQEFGVRMAMGATARNIFGMVMAQGVRRIAIGLMLGLAAAFGITRVMRGLLVQISPSDPVTFTAVALILCAVSLAACWVPARRAVRVDPVTALRYE